MATIRASCTDCGDVELTTADVTVRVCADDNQGTYSFRCPVCRMAVVKPAEPRIVELLVASGVHLSTWRLPAELSETRSGSPDQPRRPARLPRPARRRRAVVPRARPPGRGLTDPPRVAPTCRRSGSSRPPSWCSVR